MDVIEPSEIITGRDEPRRADPVHANPWVRAIARFFDYALFFLLLYALPSSAIPPVEHWIPVEYFAYIPIEALLLSTWGTTPGKFLLGSQLYYGHRKRLPFALALKRSFLVWLRGLGLGLPFINLLCLLNSYYRLKTFRATSWDRDLHTHVMHRPVPRWRFYAVGALAILGYVCYSFWKRSALGAG